ncbi:MAG: phosphatidylglycerol lysyltransferase domain-containing protein [Acidobacteriota bacterium]
MRCTESQPPAGTPNQLQRREPLHQRLVQWVVGAIPVLFIGSGLRTLTMLMHAQVEFRLFGLLRYPFPLDAVPGPPSARLLFGFATILTGIHLWARKKRARHMAVCLTIASSFFLFRGGHSARALCSLGIAALLIGLRGHFQLGSARPSLSLALQRAATAFGAALLYGTAGFWFLKPHHFGQNFHWWDSAALTLRAMLLLGDTGLEPLTPHATWFLESLFLMSAATFAYCGVVLFRPVKYRLFHTAVDREHAGSIAMQHGRSGQDFFKQWPDKSLFFSHSGSSFLAYRVANNFALALGDPVGPEDDLSATIEQFVEMCRRKGWRVGFHQVQSDRLPLYTRLGFQTMKIGDEAVVDLSRFTLEGSAMKEFRNTVNRLQRAGYSVQRIEAGRLGSLSQDLKRISDEWLQIPGHRERRFTLGNFNAEYLASATVYVVFDGQQQAVAFLNLVPSYEPGLATVDLMRRGKNSINGAMDFLFAMAFLDLKTRGYRRFSLGLAPKAEFAEHSQPSPEEQLVQWCMGHLTWIFRADSLRRFKAKYAHQWEPRYEVYRNRWELPRFALALHNITELRGDLRRAA